MRDPRRAIPSADRLLQSEPFAGLLAELPRDLVLHLLRDELDAAREAAVGGAAPPAAETYATRVQAAADRLPGQGPPRFKIIILCLREPTHHI